MAIAGAASAADIRVIPGERHQTMRGWEVTLSGLEVTPANGYDPTWATHSPRAAASLVNSVGINRVRLELTSGSENPVDYWASFQNGQIDYPQLESHLYEKVNDNADPRVAAAAGFHFGMPDFRIDHELLPIRQAVEANGESLYVSVCFVDFNGGQQGSLKYGASPNEYAELIKVFFDHLRDKYGIRPNALEIVLEPENTNDWRGLQVGQAAVAARARLQAAGYTPEIIAPSTMSAGDAVPYFNAALGASGASNVFSMISYHRYSGGDYAGIFQAAAARGIETAMLEYVPGDVDDLLEDLTIASASAWQKYAVAQRSTLSDYAYLYANLSNPSNPVFTPSATTAPLTPYFRFVRAGAVRIGAESNDGNFRPVAFINQNGAYAVIVKASAGGTLKLSGLQNGSYGVQTKLADGRTVNGADVTVSAGTASIAVQQGVVAIYDKRTRVPGGASGTPAPVPALGRWVLVVFAGCLAGIGSLLLLAVVQRTE